MVRANGDTELYMGLNQVRDLTARTRKRILQERPYASLPDFLVRADPRPVEAENLARVGALAGVYEDEDGTPPEGVAARREGEPAHSSSAGHTPAERSPNT